MTINALCKIRILRNLKHEIYILFRYSSTLRKDHTKPFVNILSSFNTICWETLDTQWITYDSNNLILSYAYFTKKGHTIGNPWRSSANKASTRISLLSLDNFVVVLRFILYRLFWTFSYLIEAYKFLSSLIRPSEHFVLYLVMSIR